MRFTGERASLGALAISADAIRHQQVTCGRLRWGTVIRSCYGISGESKREIFHSLMQKLPDMLILMLLFVPSTSRRFFQLQ